LANRSQCFKKLGPQFLQRHQRLKIENRRQVTGLSARRMGTTVRYAVSISATTLKIVPLKRTVPPWHAWLIAPLEMLNRTRSAKQTAMLGKFNP
jgi:hypothetical protein